MVNKFKKNKYSKHGYCFSQPENIVDYVDRIELPHVSYFKVHKPKSGTNEFGFEEEI